MSAPSEYTVVSRVSTQFKCRGQSVMAVRIINEQVFFSQRNPSLCCIGSESFVFVDLLCPDKFLFIVTVQIPSAALFSYSTKSFL